MAVCTAGKILVRFNEILFFPIVTIDAKSVHRIYVARRHGRLLARADLNKRPAGSHLLMALSARFGRIPCLRSAHIGVALDTTKIPIEFGDVCLVVENIHRQVHVTMAPVTFAHFFAGAHHVMTLNARSPFFLLILDV